MKKELRINKPIEKMFFSIKEVAKKYGCAQSKIRYWCEYFNLQIQRSSRDTRRFTRKDIIELDKIHFLINDGHNLKGVAKKLPTIKYSPYDTVTTNHQDEKVASYRGSPASR